MGFIVRSYRGFSYQQKTYGGSYPYVVLSKIPFFRTVSGNPKMYKSIATIERSIDAYWSTSGQKTRKYFPAGTKKRKNSYQAWSDSFDARIDKKRKKYGKVMYGR